MPYIVQTLTTPALVHHEVLAGHDFLASPTGLQRIAAKFNYVACRQKKLVFWRAQNFRAIPTVTGSPRQIWPFYFRTGENTNALDVRVGVVRTPYVAGSPPSLSTIVTRAIDDVLITDGTLYHNSSSAGTTVSPNEVAHKRLLLTGLAADTEYRILNEVQDGMVVVYMVAHEAEVRHADDSIAGVCGEGKYVAGGPVHDEHAEDLGDANNRLWRHNGAHLLSWACDYEQSTTAPGVPVITGNTSYTDVYGRDIELAMAYHSTRRRTGASGVPVKMAVSASRISGTGTLDVRIYDAGTGANIAVTGIAGGSFDTWSTATGALPDTSGAGYRIQAKQSDAITTHRIYGISLFEYEA